MAATRAVCVLVGAGILLGGCTAPPAPVEAVVDSAHVDGGYLFAGGRVTGVSEEGGTCRFTFYGSGGGASRLTSTARAEGGETICGDVDEPIATLFPGDYELILTYISPAHTLESAPFPLAIPEH